MRSTPISAALIAAAAVMMICGCSGPGRPAGDPAPRTAVISHPVFFTLKEPGDAAELIRDCDTRLATIPAVATYACGTPHDTGRPSVLEDYDVGLFVGFDSPEDYAAYVAHEDHVWLVDKWRPRIKAIRVRDFIDETP